MEQWTDSGLRREYVKAIYCHPAYLTSMQKYIMRNAGLEEAQAGIKIARRNINNVRYADDTTLLSSSQILTPSEQLLSSRDAVSVTSNMAILAC